MKRTIAANYSHGMSHPSALVQKLWNYCNILRDDGLSSALEQLATIAEDLNR